MQDAQQARAGDRPVVLLNGAPGVGKSSCLQALTAVLSRAETPWAVVDLDSLTLSGPRPPDDPFGLDVAVRNLEAVAGVYRSDGVQRLCIAHVFTERSSRERVARAAGDAAAPVVRLRASGSVVESRLRARHATDAPWELDGFLAAHEAIERALDEQALDDLVIDTDDLAPTEVAHRIARFAGWAPDAPASGSRAVE